MVSYNKKIIFIFLIVTILLNGIILAEDVDIEIPIINHTQQDNLEWSQSGHTLDTNLTPDTNPLKNVDLNMCLK